jgi:hypothetical protein
VDYDKKHGLLEEIRQSIDSKESELNAIREAQNIIEMTSEDEGIDLPDGFSDGYSSFGSGGGSGSGGSGNSAAPAPGPRGEGGSRPRGGFGGNRPNRGDGNR